MSAAPVELLFPAAASAPEEVHDAGRSAQRGNGSFPGVLGQQVNEAAERGTGGEPSEAPDHSEAAAELDARSLGVFAQAPVAVAGEAGGRTAPPEVAPNSNGPVVDLDGVRQPERPLQLLVADDVAREGVTAEKPPPLGQERPADPVGVRAAQGPALPGMERGLALDSPRLDATIPVRGEHTASISMEGRLRTASEGGLRAGPEGGSRVTENEVASQLASAAVASRPLPPAVGGERDAPRSIRSRGSDREIGALLESRRSPDPQSPRTSGEPAQGAAAARNPGEEVGSFEGLRAGAAPNLTGSAPEPLVAVSAPGGEGAAVVAPASESANASVARRGSAPAVPVEEVPVRVEWLAHRGGGTARLELDPPQLGRVELTVRMRGAEVEVVITTSEPLAHAAVQSQRAQLAENLAARDLRLSQFEVNDSGAEGQLGSHAGGSHGWESDGRGEALAPRDPTIAGDASPGVKVRTDLPERTRERTVDPAMSRIDLHI
ncbi:MAG: flagellar hook-length control protein FliK [Myxococcota bacterium]